MKSAPHSELQQLFERLQDSPSPEGMGGLCALVDGQEEALPLQLLKVRSQIAGNCARTIVEQHFYNGSASTIEVTHIFPLPVEGALISMELEAGDLCVRGLCKERTTAEVVYHDAKARGKRVALITQERDDIHTLRVSGISPKTSVVIRFTVIEFLDSIDGRFFWRFPTTIAPRFRPGVSIGHRGPGVLDDSDRVPDASFLHAPARLEGGTALDLEVKVFAPVQEVESNFHTVKMSLETEGVRVTPTGQTTLNKDFVLAYSNGDEQDVSLRAWTDGEYSLAILQAPHEQSSKGLARDAVYVIDISGSMEGTKLDAAKRALSKSLKGLRSEDRFLLIAFNTELRRYKDDFRQATWLNVKKALWWINGLGAGGGTDMLPAIQIALMGETPAARVRTVLFITDGQASNEAELVATVAKRRKKARFFCLGIDTAVNSALLQSLSRVGGGTCELTGPQGDIEALVAKIEQRFGHPLIDEVLVEGGELGAEGGKALFKGRPVTVLLKGAPELIRCRGQAGSGTVSMETRPAKVSFSLGPLWAKRRIAFLQDRQTIRPFEREGLRPVITKLALEYSLLSRYTAFVAVDESSAVLEKPHSVIQPVEAPDLWSSQNGQGSFYQPVAEETKLTADGACVGVPYYMAPEQVQGLKMDQRTDIYSLGLAFYTILTGRRGFEGKTMIGVIQAILKETLKNPQKVNPAIPKIVSNLILKMTAKKPKDRFQSCEEVLSALHKLPFDWGQIPDSYSELKSRSGPVNGGHDPILELIGITVFDCVIETLHDRDGYCCVFEARHASGQMYFIDVVPKGGQDDRIRRRIKAAVALTSKIKKAHVLRVLALAESAEHFFVLKDYMNGESLEDRRRRWREPQIEEGLIYLHQALLGLSEAHKNGLLHGRLAPEHMLISKNRFLKLTGFTF